MSRFPQQRVPLDSPVVRDLDVRWRGLNERDEPGTLPGRENAAYVTAALNVTFKNGRPETRCGFVGPVAWNPARLPSVGSFYAGKHLGAGLYVDPQGREWMLLARAHLDVNPYYRIWQVKDGVNPLWTRPQWDYTGDFADKLKAAELVTFTQSGPEMILWRRGLEPLHWSGDVDGEWQPSSTAEVPADTASFMQPLPAADFGVAIAGRVVFPVGAGEIGWTDIQAPRRWDAALNRYSISGETGGGVTALSAWRRQTLVIFKAGAVYALNNFSGDLSGTTLERVTDQAGCIAPRTITAVGGDLIWLGNGAVYRMTEVLENSTQLSPVPVSWPIPRSMGRVNWQAAAGMACAALADGLWYLAVPVDGSSVNNALFVFDTRTGEWQGEYSLEAWQRPALHAMTRTTLYGRETVALVTPDRVLGAGQGWHDGEGEGDIRTRVAFRGYALEDVGLKRLRGLIVDTEEHGTLGASLVVDQDGVRVARFVNDTVTRDRTKYLPWGWKRRDLTNSDDTANTPEREDYAWVLEDNTQICSGVQLGIMQVHQLKGMCAGEARWVKPIVEAGGGRIRINAVRAEGYPLPE